MNLLLASWVWEFLGRLHPMVVHFPIGILVVAFGFQLFSLRNSSPASSHIKSWVQIGALSAVISALFGTLLYQFGSYSGSLITQHLWGGWITAGLACMAAFTYSSRWPSARYMPVILLGLSVGSLSLTGHWGASITHGASYLTEVLPFNKKSDPGEVSEKLALFTSYSQQDSFPTDQLDQLNLEVRAIFAHNCYQCHSTEKQKGGLVLDQQAGVFQGGDSGPILEQGNSRNSEIIRRLRLPRAEEEAMPPKGKVLPEEEINLIELWIDQGAHWADAALKIFPEAEMALSQPQLPAGKSAIEHPIDKFVDRYFEQNKKKWPRIVEDKILIRRLYLDIVGLLPEPRAVASFEESRDPNKRSHLIDSLFSHSDPYAQHALTFWNDLLRNDYSGTGYITGGRKQISSWLYSSLRENKPYDVMLRELVNPNSASEGFIKGIQWRGAVNSSQSTPMQAAQNISQSLLGLNMKCASCHNSFVNNLSLDRSYAFANVFSDTTMEIFRCDKPTGRMAHSGFIYPELGTITGADKATRLRELAELMSTPENGRVYRTLVNRYWNLLLGRGLVAPVDDMDQPPWETDLLDWLTADFIAHDYDIQHLLKQILTSDTYALESFAYPSLTYLQSQAFEFQGPVPRRLSAEQFLDAVSDVIHPVYSAVSFDPSGYSSQAEWIWHPEIEVDRHVLPKPGERFLRKEFTIRDTSVLATAQLLLAGDDAFTCYLNGEKVLAGTDKKEVYSREVTAFLLPGSNVFAIEGVNEGLIPNPASILLSLQLIDTDGKETYVVSDNSWKSTAEIPASGWKEPSFQDEDWESVRRYGRFKRSPWGQPLAFRHHTDSTDTPPLPYARASLVQLDPFQKALGRPTRENVSTSRSGEASLLQTLSLSNDKDFHDVISRGAESWTNAFKDNPEELLDQLFEKGLGRKPNPQERRLLLKGLQSPLEQEAVEDVLWSFILLPEFQFIL